MSALSVRDVVHSARIITEDGNWGETELERNIRVSGEYAHFYIKKAEIIFIEMNDYEQARSSDLQYANCCNYLYRVWYYYSSGSEYRKLEKKREKYFRRADFWTRCHKNLIKDRT